jgi:signal transduction histidine kinase
MPILRPADMDGRDSAAARPSSPRLMHSADGLVTVGVVARDQLAERPPRGPLAGAFGERPWLAAVVLIVGIELVTLAVTVGSKPAPGRHLVLGLIVCGVPIVLLRRWPLPVLAVATAATGLVMIWGNAPLPFGILIGLAMYLAAARLPRRVSISTAVVAATALGGAIIYGALARRAAPLAMDALEGFVPLTAAWFIGDSVAARRRYVAGLAEQAERERAAEVERARQQVREERMRIAHELHDVVAHTLAVITVQAGVGRRLMAKHPEEGSTALESIEMIGRTAQDELAVVLGLLRDEQSGGAALAPAPRLVDLKELAENVRASGTPVELRLSGADRRLSPALELSIFRVIQEALTNVVKHAAGARAAVVVTVSAGRIRLEVTDDGGTAAHPAGGGGPPGNPGSGHGIVGMRERIAAFGGWLVAEPLPGGGFQVLAEVPAEGAG